VVVVTNTPEFHLKSNHYSFVKASKAQISL
jgi:hypothetical protein